MKTTLLILFLAFASFGANVTFTLSDILGTQQTIQRRTVEIAPMSTPRTNAGPVVVLSDRRFFNTGTNGTFVATNLVFGIYQVSVWGINYTSVFHVAIPETSSSYNAVDLVINLASGLADSEGSLILTDD